MSRPVLRTCWCGNTTGSLFYWYPQCATDLTHIMLPTVCLMSLQYFYFVSFHLVWWLTLTLEFTGCICVAFRLRSSIVPQPPSAAPLFWNGAALLNSCSVARPWSYHHNHIITHDHSYRYVLYTLSIWSVPATEGLEEELVFVPFWVFLLASPQ